MRAPRIGYSEGTYDADRKNVNRCAIVLFVIGALLIALGFKIELYSYYPYTIIVPIMYLIPPIIRIFSSQHESNMKLRLFKASLIALIIFNLFVFVGAIVFLIFTLMNPYVKPENEDSNLGGGIFLLLQIIDVISIIASFSIAALLFLFLRFVNTFQQKINEIEDFQYELRDI